MEDQKQFHIFMSTAFRNFFHLSDAQKSNAKNFLLMLTSCGTRDLE